MHLNHPQTIPNQFMEKLSSIKLVPGAKQPGDHCSITPRLWLSGWFLSPLFFLSFVLTFLFCLRQNIHTNKTKGKPQTYGKYKIRQIIAEIMEYTHTYTHINKTKIVQKIKYESGPTSDGNQK